MIKPKSLVPVMLLICGILVPQPAQALGSADERPAVTHGPYLQHVTDQSALVIWFTNTNCVSHIEYATGDNFETFPHWGGLVATARNVRHGLIAANTRRHAVRIEGLEPGRTYRYRLISTQIIQFEPYEVLFGDTIVSEILEFKTQDPAKETVSFFLFQDIHGDTARLEGMLERLPLDEVDMVFFNGDTVNYLTGEEPLFQGFLDISVNRFAKETPFLYIRGNHETRGDFARSLMDYFPPREGHYYYSFSHGPARFIILDSGEDKPDASPVYAGLTDFEAYRRVQAEWLKQEIRTEAFQTAKFRIAVFHIPPVREDRFVPGEIRRLWVPPFNEGGLDILFCGHAHRFSRHAPEEGKHDFPIIVGPARGVVRVQVTETQLAVGVESETGELLDSFVLEPRRREE